MKSIFQSVIKNGGYNLTDMLGKIDQYHIAGKLTDRDRDELYTLARDGADPSNKLDILSKLLEIEDRVTKLEKAGSQAESGNGEHAEEYPEYVVGKWYRNGNRMTFEGTRYICTAPDGVVCTWSPAEYPPYWQEVTE